MAGAVPGTPSGWGLKKRISRVTLAPGHEPHEEIAVPFRAVASESNGPGSFDTLSDILVLLWLEAK